VGELIQVRHVDFIAQPVSDLKRSESFYGGTLGLMRNPGSGERWVEYETGNLTVALSTFGGTLALRVDDVNAAREKLESDGVEFAMDTFDSGVCNGAPFTDPDGNRLLLHRRYAPPDTWELESGDIQRTDFVGVSVTDRDRGSEFYGGRLGLDRNQLSSDEWPEFAGDNVGVVLSTPAQRMASEHKPEFSVAFRVPDVAESMERLQGQGVEFGFPEPYDSGVCHMAFFRDPDGNPLILHHRYAPYSDGSTP
jgi:catechol 2,3-dioxygenase-like lactoylglutathione lyase family enzyme